MRVGREQGIHALWQLTVLGDVGHKIWPDFAFVLIHNLRLAITNVLLDDGFIVGHSDLDVFMPNVGQVFVHCGVQRIAQGHKNWDLAVLLGPNNHGGCSAAFTHSGVITNDESLAKLVSLDSQSQTIYLVTGQSFCHLLNRWVSQLIGYKLINVSHLGFQPFQGRVGVLRLSAGQVNAIAGEP